MPVELRLARLRRGVVRRDAARVLSFVDEGVHPIRRFWPGLAARRGHGRLSYLAGPEPDRATSRVDPDGGAVGLRTFDSCVIACGDGGTAEALRADIVKTVAPSSDPRLVQRREQSKTTGTSQGGRRDRASLRRNAEFQLGSPSDESSADADAPKVAYLRNRPPAQVRH